MNQGRGSYKDWKYDLKSTYGLTPEGYEAILVSQGGKCWICGKTPSENGKRLSVDHIHGPDPIVIRGLLCADCNTGLGFFHDVTERLWRAQLYLQEKSSSADPSLS